MSITPEKVLHAYRNHQLRPIRKQFRSTLVEDTVHCCAVAAVVIARHPEMRKHGPSYDCTEWFKHAMNDFDVTRLYLDGFIQGFDGYIAPDLDHLGGPNLTTEDRWEVWHGWADGIKVWDRVRREFVVKE